MSTESWVVENLPNSWVVTPINSLCNVVRGGSPRPMGDPRYFNGNIPFIKISDVTRSNGVTVEDSETKVNLEGAKKSRFLQKGTLILSNSGTVCVPVFLGVDACIHDGFVTFESLPEEVDAKYLYYFFRYIRPYVLNKYKQGITQVNLNTTLVGEMDFLFPPTNEQARIVAAIEQQFTRLDSAVASLRSAQAKVKQYRASLLKAAVEGELTKEWRAAHPTSETGEQLLARILVERRARWEEEQLAKGNNPKNMKYSEPVTPNISELPELPRDWVWTTMSAITLYGPQNGLYLPKSDYGQGVPILRIDDFQNHTSKASSQLRLVNANREDAERYMLYMNDLVINRVNSPTHLGKCLIVLDRNLPALFESNMMRLRLTQQISAKFVETYLHSDIGRKHLTKNAKWAVNQASINQGDVNRTPIPLPPLTEQLQIVAEVEERLSTLTQLEQAIEHSLKRAEHERQSILREAFAGRLVEQDPTDEPASVLLERIREERAEREGVEKAARRANGGRGKQGNGQRQRPPAGEPSDALRRELQEARVVQMSWDMQD